MAASGLRVACSCFSLAFARHRRSLAVVRSFRQQISVRAPIPVSREILWRKDDVIQKTDTVRVKQRRRQRPTTTQQKKEKTSDHGCLAGWMVAGCNLLPAAASCPSAAAWRGISLFFGSRRRRPTSLSFHSDDCATYVDGGNDDDDKDFRRKQRRRSSNDNNGCCCRRQRRRQSRLVGRVADLPRSSSSTKTAATYPKTTTRRRRSCSRILRATRVSVLSLGFEAIVVVLRRRRMPQS